MMKLKMEDMKRQLRDVKITIRCTERERERIRDNTTIAGVTMTQYILYMTTRPIASVKFENTDSKGV